MRLLTLPRLTGDAVIPPPLSPRVRRDLRLKNKRQTPYLKKNRLFQANVALFLIKFAQEGSKLCEGTAMKDVEIMRWLPWALAAMVLVAGCALLESKDSSGKVDRLKLDTGERWDTYDDRPRYPSANTGKHGLDDMSIMLKSEKTF